MKAMTFTPAQAARISGVNATLQRDWRRRKILPALTQATASYTPFEVAQLMALNALAEQGLSPLSYKSVAGKLGACIVAKALTEARAYMGAVERFVPFDGEGLERILASEQHFPLAVRSSVMEESLSNWRLWNLSKSITSQAGYSVTGLESFIQFADGSFEFYGSAITAFETIDDTDPRLQGAIIVVDLRALGGEFARRAGAFVYLDSDFVDEWNERPGMKAIIRKIDDLRERVRTAGE
nr:hypothetical protein [uncultured Brevundimonas sp.]